MNKLSKSPERNTFQRDHYLKQASEQGRTPENDETVRAIAEIYEEWDREQSAHESDPDWAEDNLEYALRSTDWILHKVRSSDDYAQALYAAMCNNDFQKLAVYPILADKTWSCTWRYAGGIIANMRQSGDYIDWYCSGNESHVTEEIADDLERLGWRVIELNE